MTSKQTVLLVEDEHNLRHSFRDTLAIAGYEVLEAGDGVAALHIVETQLPDLVVLDVGLPRFDGRSVREELAANDRTRRVPVIFVTGFDDVERFVGDGLLHKPVSSSELLKAVRRMLDPRH